MPSAAVAIPWHALAPRECLEAVDGSTEGLSTAQGAERLARLGPNRLEMKGGRSNLRILWDQFSNVMLIMLLAVAAVSAGVAFAAQRFPKDAIAIVLIVGLNALLGYLQESRAQQALKALRDMAQPLVTVRRDGSWERLSSEQLVPGDLIRLEAGDRVPADGRLLEVAELGLREAALTGEAEAVTKRADLVLEASTPVLERQNCLFQGTEVVRGRGTAVVTATGMGTELGRIARMIDSAGGETTPLQERLDGLANVLVASALALVAGVVLLGWLMGQRLLDLLEVGLSMAVAIVPEGLPAVITVTLAIGTQRMVQRSALIRRLPAVEALGSVTVICTDKTGTLTQNRQVVQELRSGTRSVAVSGNGYEPKGAFRAAELVPPEGAIAGLAPGARDLLLQAGVLCSDAELKQEPDGRWEILGDPTEGALVVAAAKAELDGFALRSHYRRLAEIPFSSERQLMAVWVQDREGLLQIPLGQASAGSTTLMISKGAPEVILATCDRWLDGSGVVALSEAQRQWWLAEARGLAASGLRVLAFACAPHHPSPEQELEHQVLLGLMAQLDPARPEVALAASRCREAGIRPVMITGDHPLTAAAIGSSIGLVGADAEVVLGKQLEAADDETLAAMVRPLQHLCQGAARAEAADRQGLPGPGAGGGHDRRRGQRRSGPEAGPHRRGHGHHGHGGEQGGLRHGAARRQLRHHRQRGGAGAPGVRQHPPLHQVHPRQQRGGADHHRLCPPAGPGGCADDAPADPLDEPGDRRFARPGAGPGARRGRPDAAPPRRAGGIDLCPGRGQLHPAHRCGVRDHHHRLDAHHLQHGWSLEDHGLHHPVSRPDGPCPCGPQ